MIYVNRVRISMYFTVEPPALCTDIGGRRLGSVGEVSQTNRITITNGGTMGSGGDYSHGYHNL